MKRGVSPVDVGEEHSNRGRVNIASTPRQEGAWRVPGLVEDNRAGVAGAEGGRLMG